MSGCQTQKENLAGQITDAPTLEVSSIILSVPFFPHSSCFKTHQHNILKIGSGESCNLYPPLWYFSFSLLISPTTFQDLLLEIADVDEDLSQIVTFKDSIAASSTAEARASLSQQVDNLQSHKRALEGSISDSLTLFTQESIQRVQRLGEEAPCLQTALKDLAEILGNLCEDCEVLPDVRELKQKWGTLQVPFKDPTKSWTCPSAHTRF